jgi:hypothetical protein
MNTKDFLRLGVPLGEATRRATDFVAQFIPGGETTLSLPKDDTRLPIRPMRLVCRV